MYLSRGKVGERKVATGIHLACQGHWPQRLGQPGGNARFGAQAIQLQAIPLPRRLLQLRRHPLGHALHDLGRAQPGVVLPGQLVLLAFSGAQEADVAQAAPGIAEALLADVQRGQGHRPLLFIPQQQHEQPALVPVQAPPGAHPVELQHGGHRSGARPQLPPGVT